MRKKKIVYMSDYAMNKTGFGRVAKALLTHLHNTGKYELVNYCCGLQKDHPDLKRTPWKSIGCLPNSQQEINLLNQDPGQARAASYGAYLVDQIVKEEKPDVFFAVQDWWGIDFCIDKPWFSKITSCLWTTLDSVPILPGALEKAPKVKNYWVWADFAETALHKAGHTHVKTVYGSVDASNFSRLLEHKRKDLRQQSNIPEDAFVVGFVFRNQLRKSVPNLMEGYSTFRKSGVVNPRLLLHTNFFDGGGWDIMRLAKEFNVPQAEILTTYICRNCLDYEVKAFCGNDVSCKHCGSDKGQINTGPGLGVSETQLNEVYNLIDCYVHPITSGGLEVPIIEAKYCEIPMAVTNYSCGETFCVPEAQTLTLDWAEYREPNGTQFIKATTYPHSIAKQARKIYDMPVAKRREMGKLARQWALERFNTPIIGAKFEEFIDKAPYTEYDFNFAPKPKNPDYVPSDCNDDLEWTLELYKNILNMEVDASDSGVQYWMNFLKK